MRRHQGICHLSEQGENPSLSGHHLLRREKDGVLVEVAMQHNDSYTESTYSFVNNITTRREEPILPALEMP